MKARKSGMGTRVQRTGTAVVDHRNVLEDRASCLGAIARMSELQPCLLSFSLEIQVLGRERQTILA